MHAFPPESFDWRLWIWPVVLLAGLVAFVALRSKRSKSTLIALGCGVSIAAACCLSAQFVLEFREFLCRTQCANNIKWITLAVHEYHDRYGRFPPPSLSESGRPPTSWRIDLLSCFSPAPPPELTAEYDRNRPWDDPINEQVAKRRMNPYCCPTNRAPQDATGRWHTAYAFVTGPGTPFPAEGPLTIRDITDGTSGTLLLAEACGRNIIWTEPRDVDVSQQALRINAPGTEPGTSDGVLSSYHSEGAHCALVDGSVRFLDASISEEVLRALSTTAAEDDPREF
jgi:hypothetical protein